MPEKYTKDRLTEIIIESNSKMVEAMSFMKENLKAINDQNVLHSQTIERNTITVKELVIAINMIAKNLRWIILLFFLVIGALIILAGAENVFKHIPVSL